MPNIFEPSVAAGEPTVADARFAIAVARYNASITTQLLTAAVDTLGQHGIADTAMDVGWVPGAWELPVLAQQFAAARRYDAVLCLGAVIRGETSHDQHINQQVSASLGKLALDFELPILFGVLTCHTLEQAIHRAGGRSGNKGAECAEAALQMVSVRRQLAAHLARG